MRTLLIVLAIVAALFALLLAAIVFFMGGGFDRWSAERDVKQRGYRVSEPIDIDGLWRMQLAPGWRRDTYLETLPGGALIAGPLGTLNRRELIERNFARAYLALGRYSHIGGTVTSATADVRVLTPGAPAFDINPSGDGARMTWREHQRDEAGVAYVPTNASAADLDLGPWVVYLRTQPGVRVEARADGQTYNLAQLAVLAREMALSVEPNASAMAAALADYDRRHGATQLAIDASRALVQQHFGLSRLGSSWDEAVSEPGGSFVWSNPDSVQILYRVGAVANPKAEEAPALLARLSIDPSRVTDAMRDSARTAIGGGPDLEIIGVWRDANGEMSFNGIQHTGADNFYDKSVPLAIAVLPRLSSNELPLFRLQSFSWTQTNEIRAFLEASGAIRAAADEGRPIWAAQ